MTTTKKRAISPRRLSDRREMGLKLMKLGWPFGTKTGDGVIIWESRGETAEVDEIDRIAAAFSGESSVPSQKKHFAIHARIFVHENSFIADVVKGDAKLLECHFGKAGRYINGFVCGQQVDEDSLIGLFTKYTDVMGGPILIDADSDQDCDLDEDLISCGSGDFESSSDFYGVDVSMAFERA